MSARDLDNGFILEAMPAFVSEALEQIERIEQLLLELEDRPADRDLLDELFRCAHTVKGSAGIFGLDAVVAFTHHVETLLDRLRAGEIGFDPALGTLLLRCGDQMRWLVEAARDGGAETPAQAAQRETLEQQLRAMCHADAAPKPAPAPAAEPGVRRWHVAVAFGPQTFRNGMDPAAILAYVAGLGHVSHIVCDHRAVPALEALDPESCHLGFSFALDTARGREAIESAFSFVRDDCTLEITEPGMGVDKLAARIEALPDQPRLGDILVSVGAISPVQLSRGLEAQATAPEAPLGEILQQRTGLAPQVVQAALKKQSRARDAAADDTRYIRVQADRLDAVINLLGELVIASAGAELLARDSRQAALLEANQQVGRLVEEIRNGTLQLRMVPIGETFSRFRRVVRDTAAELGKDVRLEIEGADTELDKSVVERIADPLMHLVRNALDHGLEPPAERAAAGKPAQGTLKLAARHEAGSILIRISDDGRGIQRRKVLERAWQRGLLEPGSVPPDDEICRLIFAPGFSTAEQVTNLSGRGVGMDVVRKNIEALRGSVVIDSVEGQGSTIEIRLPLTLAIIDGFLVGVGGAKFIFPLDAVVEVIENRPAAGRVDAQGRGCVELRGHTLPVVSLRALYGLPGSEPARASIVVLRGADGRRFGARVDQLLGQHQTVIKPLSRLFKSLRGMAGSSILGNGEVALIFDVPALGNLAAGRSAAAASQGPSQGPSA